MGRTSTPAAGHMAFGALLRQYRLAAILSQEALAERAGLSVDAISLIERGKRGAPRQGTVSLLARALDLDPEQLAAFVAAARAIRTTATASAFTSEPAARSHCLPPLPVPLTSFIGREAEVAAVRDRLLEPATRLLTLTGPGGTGKTRLALQVAHQVEAAFPDGVAFVDLAPIVDPALVLPTIAQTVRVTAAGRQTVGEALTTAFRTRRLLLVLDNFEQLLEAGPAVAELLTTCPDVRALVTSRAALHLRGERLHPVPPLTVPDSGPLPPAGQLERYEAVRLFIERAKDLRVEFALTGENAAAVAEICTRLDGLPLAIELAAGWVRLFSPSALLAPLQRRLLLLTGGARDLPARQQTLRATIDWSYALLSPEEQTLLARLSVFAGGWTLDAAEAICHRQRELDFLKAMAGLLDKNLVGQEGKAEPRFSMAESIKEYASERLREQGEEAGTRTAHARYFTRLAEEAEPKLRGPEQTAWLEQLEQEHENLRAALRLSLQDEPARGLQLAGALWLFWLIRGHVNEGRGWLETALARSDLVADPASIAKALSAAGALAERQNELERARQLHEDALRLRREVGDKQGEASSLNNLGVVALGEADYQRAKELFQESLHLRRELGDTWGTAAALANLGDLALRESELDRARELFEESLGLWRRLGDKRWSAIMLNMLGIVAMRRCDCDRAEQLHLDSLRIMREMGSKDGAASALIGLAALAGRRHEHERALQLLGAAQAIWTQVGAGSDHSFGDILDEVAASARAVLSPEAYEAAWQQGRARGLERAVEEVLGEGR